MPWPPSARGGRLDRPGRPVLRLARDPRRRPRGALGSRAGPRREDPDGARPAPPWGAPGRDRWDALRSSPRRRHRARSVGRAGRPRPAGRGRRLPRSVSRLCPHSATPRSAAGSRGSASSRSGRSPRCRARRSSPASGRGGRSPPRPGEWLRDGSLPSRAVPPSGWPSRLPSTRRSPTSTRSASSCAVSPAPLPHSLTPGVRPPAGLGSPRRSIPRSRRAACRSPARISRRRSSTQRLPEPTADPEALERLLLERLERDPPRVPVVRLELELLDVSPGHGPPAHPLRSPGECRVAPRLAARPARRPVRGGPRGARRPGRPRGAAPRDPLDVAPGLCRRDRGTRGRGAQRRAAGTCSVTGLPWALVP